MASNRLFIALTVVWAVYCALVYPFIQRAKAQTIYDDQVQYCYQEKLGEGQEFKDCLNLANAVLHNGTYLRLPHQYYKSFWPEILAAVLVMPLLVYGLIRLVAAVGVWICRDMQVESRSNPEGGFGPPFLHLFTMLRQSVSFLLGPDGFRPPSRWRRIVDLSDSSVHGHGFLPSASC